PIIYLDGSTPGTWYGLHIQRSRHNQPVLPHPRREVAEHSRVAVKIRRPLILGHEHVVGGPCSELLVTPAGRVEALRQGRIPLRFPLDEYSGQIMEPVRPGAHPCR